MDMGRMGVQASGQGEGGGRAGRPAATQRRRLPLQHPLALNIYKSDYRNGTRDYLAVVVARQVKHLALLAVKL